MVRVICIFMMMISTNPVILAVIPYRHMISGGLNPFHLRQSYRSLCIYRQRLWDLWNNSVSAQMKCRSTTSLLMRQDAHLCQNASLRWLDRFHWSKDHLLFTRSMMATAGHQKSLLMMAEAVTGVWFLTFQNTIKEPIQGLMILIYQAKKIKVVAALTPFMMQRLVA